LGEPGVALELPELGREREHMLPILLGKLPASRRFQGPAFGDVPCGVAGAVEVGATRIAIRRLRSVRHDQRATGREADSGSPGATSSSGGFTGPGRAMISARASGIGSTESQSTGSRTWTSRGST